MASIEQLAQDWLALDKEPQTRAEIQKLLDYGNHVELEKRLRNRISFGTAGLRGRMEAGFSRMNSLTVIQASQGLAEYVLKIEPEKCRNGIVIGYDSRHNSSKFAKLVAAAFVNKGIKVWWFEETCHTPLVAFAVLELSAAAGIMITASHNPAGDNGYKVYWSNGCQITTPHDKGIAKSISEHLKPLSWDTGIVDNGNLLVEACLERMKDCYFNALERVCPPKDLRSTAVSLKFVYTPMHGVGLPFMRRAVEQIGLQDEMSIVEAQAHPDPDFPTVKFPNPEEAGALDLAFATGDAVGASYVIATDPDADRLAVAQKVDDKWYQFSGNQLGILLAAFTFERYPKSADISKLAMLTTVVSTRMLREMGRQEGFHVEETLTGFKWIATAMLRLRHLGYDVRFGFEEALGYMFPELVHDKDGISAAIAFLNAILQWSKDENLTPWDKLQQLYAKYGHFSTSNTYFVSPDPQTTNRVFESIRSLAKPFPQRIGSFKILRFQDLTEGYDSGTKDTIPLLPVSKSSQMISCETEGDIKFTLRGSGTEPKIKVYIEAKAGSESDAQSLTKEILEGISQEWLQPEQNGLVSA